MAVQLPLQFEFQSNLNFDSYYPGDNAEITAHLKSFINNGNEQQIYIWGEQGIGKTHLLQACCHAANINNITPFYLNLNEDNPPKQEILTGMEEIEIVCLDNIEQIAGDPDWEQALFNFYNRHRDNNHRLLLAASCPPIYLPFLLPDLKSRMGWGLTLNIKPMTEQQLMEAINHKAHYRGFQIRENILRFLSKEYHRNLPELWRILDKIDYETLSSKRKLSIKYLKSIITAADEQ